MATKFFAGDAVVTPPVSRVDLGGFARHFSPVDQAKVTPWGMAGKDVLCDGKFAHQRRDLAGVQPQARHVDLTGLACILNGLRRGLDADAGRRDDRVEVGMGLHEILGPRFGWLRLKRPDYELGLWLERECLDTPGGRAGQSWAVHLGRHGQGLLRRDNRCDQRGDPMARRQDRRCRDFWWSDTRQPLGPRVSCRRRKADAGDMSRETST